MKWSQYDIDVLKELYPSHTIYELQAMLPKRTKDMINSMIKRLKAAGELGEKTEEARLRAYKQRVYDQPLPQLQNVDDTPLFTVDQAK